MMLHFVLVGKINISLSLMFNYQTYLFFQNFAMTISIVMHMLNESKFKIAAVINPYIGTKPIKTLNPSDGCLPPVKNKCCITCNKKKPFQICP